MANNLFQQKQAQELSKEEDNDMNQKASMKLSYKITKSEGATSNNFQNSPVIFDAALN